MSEISLYKVNSWLIGSSYSKNDIVLYANNYYYSLTDNNLGNTPSLSPSNLYWGGYKTYSSLTKPQFIWKPTYATQLQMKPAVNLIKFGNGYEQRIADGINNNLQKFNLNFEGRDKNETRAIAHFLHKRKGVDSFFFDAPFPYNFDDSQSYPKRFLCDEWDVNYNFYNNYNITAKFSETANV